MQVVAFLTAVCVPIMILTATAIISRKFTKTLSGEIVCTILMAVVLLIGIGVLR